MNQSVSGAALMLAAAFVVTGQTTTKSTPGSAPPKRTSPAKPPRTQQPGRPIDRTVWSGRPIAVGSVSANGRYFVYTETPPADLFVHDLVTGQERNLTNNKKGSRTLAGYPRISPDSTQVAYCWIEEPGKAQVRVLSLTGDSLPRVLYSPDNTISIGIFDWSVDGRSLAVQVNRANRSSAISLLSLTDGSVRPLKTIEGRGSTSMHFSPDGKYLACDLPQSAAAAERDIFVLSTSGHQEFRAVADPGNDVPLGWSPDGKWLVFTSDRTGTLDIWAAPFKNGRTMPNPQLLRSNFGSSLAAGWNAGGALYYASRHGGPVNRLAVGSIDLADGSFSSTPIVDSFGAQLDVAWSPDGSDLAYAVSVPGVGSAIAIRNAATGSVRNVRPRELAWFSVRRWAQDGHSIVVDAADLDGRIGLYRVDALTGDAPAIFTYSPASEARFSAYDMAWLPGGRSLLIEGNGTKGGIYRVDSQTGELAPVFLNGPGQVSGDLRLSLDSRRVFFNLRTESAHQTSIMELDLMSGAAKEMIRGPLFNPAVLSPDGQYLATGTADTASNSRVVLAVPTAGGKPRELVRVPSEINAPETISPTAGQWVWPHVWTPDGQAVIARRRPADRTKGGELWILPLAGGPPRKIEGRIPENSGMVMSRDARHVAFPIQEPATPMTAEISILEDFLPTNPRAGTRDSK